MKNVIITIFTLTTLNRMCKEVPKLKRKFAEADRVIEKIHSLKEEYLIKVDEQLASLTYKFITTDLVTSKTDSPTRALGFRRYYKGYNETHLPRRNLMEIAIAIMFLIIFGSFLFIRGCYRRLVRLFNNTTNYASKTAKKINYVRTHR
jgi:hypothetical protein